MSASDDDYVNPELPPEIAKIQNEDLIGNTLFSKHWLFELLLKLIQKLENEVVEIEAADESSKLKCYDSSQFKELDPDFEKDLCDLWDMSVEKDVCLVLDEFNGIQIFEGFIKKFDCIYPRAVEILIGVLINMASLSDEICLKLVSNKSFIQYLLFNVLSQMADVPTIIQVIKLFDLFLSDTKRATREIFIDYLKHELLNKKLEGSHFSLNWHGIIDKFYFILEQSLNALLLDSTCSLLFKLFDNDEQILSAFCINHRIIDALCNASLTRLRLDKANKTFTHTNFTTSRREVDSEKVNSSQSDKNQTPYVSLLTQLSDDDMLTIDHLFVKYFLCLQTLSTCESGVVCLLDRSSIVIELFDEYLGKCLSTFNDWEIKSSHSLKATVSNDSLKNIICVLSILNSIFPNEQNLVECDYRHPKFFLKLVTLSNYYLKFFNELKNSNNQDEDGEYLESLNLARSNMLDLFKNLVVLNGENHVNLVNMVNKSLSLINQ